MISARLSIRDAAAYVGIPYETFRKMRMNGRIPVQAIKLEPHRRNGTVLYERADLDAWLASRREPA